MAEADFGNERDGETGEKRFMGETYPELLSEISNLLEFSHLHLEDVPISLMGLKKVIESVKEQDPQGIFNRYGHLFPSLADPGWRDPYLIA